MPALEIEDDMIKELFGSIFLLESIVKKKRWTRGGRPGDGSVHMMIRGIMKSMKKGRREREGWTKRETEDVQWLKAEEDLREPEM